MADVQACSAQERRGSQAAPNKVGLRPGGSASSTEPQVQAERGAGCVHLQRVSFQNGGGVGESASAQGPTLQGEACPRCSGWGRKPLVSPSPPRRGQGQGSSCWQSQHFFSGSFQHARLTWEGEDVLTCSDAACGPGHGWPPGRFGGRALRPLLQQGRGHFLIRGGACGGTRCQGPGGSPGPDGEVGDAWVWGGLSW